MSIRVMVVDDSFIARAALSRILSADPVFGEIETAADPIFAMEKMVRQWPDVIVLDIEMPRMNGITFLKKIMRDRPTPVVICSAYTNRGAQITMQALAAGAATVIAKPGQGIGLEESAVDLVHEVKAAYHANVLRLRTKSRRVSGVVSMSHDVMKHVIAIGASTGGTQAIESVLTSLPYDCPGLVVVQHMPPKFTAAFAARLNRVCAIEVREARDKDKVAQGLALIAPGGLHMRLFKTGEGYSVRVFEGEPVNRHRPSVDVLMESVAYVAGSQAVGVIMTGMGDDGARGMKRMRDAGAYTLAQDESSSVVFGMPREAIRLGGVDKVVGLDKMAMAMLATREKGI